MDSFELLAIALGGLALAIAIWDDLRDRIFYARSTGPVSVNLVFFDIPDRNLLVHQVPIGGTIHQYDATAVRMEWELWNHVSWPVYISFSIVATRISPEKRAALLAMIGRNELMEETGSSFFVPPRQPVHFTLWAYWARGEPGSLSPTCTIRGPRWILKRGPTKSVTWADGMPSLSD